MFERIVEFFVFVAAPAYLAFLAWVLYEVAR